MVHSCHVTSILVSDWCRDNHIERVLACHSLGVDVNVVSQDGFLSGLTVAAHNNCIQVRGWSCGGNGQKSEKGLISWKLSVFGFKYCMGFAGLGRSGAE